MFKPQKFLIHEYTLKQQQQTGKVYFPFPCLILMKEGQAQLISEFDTFLVNSGDIILVPSWLLFTLKSLSSNLKCSFISINIQTDFLPLSNHTSGIYHNSKGHDFLYQCFYLIQSLHSNDLYYHSSIEAFQRIIVNYLLNIEGNLIKPINYSPPIQKTINYIHGHLHMDLSLKHLSQIAQLSESRFSFRFKADLGISPHRYIQNLKLNQAYYRIRSNPKMEIKEVARQFGFNNLSHFSTIFKKKFSLTPQMVKKIAPKNYAASILPGDLNFFSNE